MQVEQIKSISFATKTCIDIRQSEKSVICPHNMANFGPLAADTVADPELEFWKGDMASAGARAYNGGLGAQPPAGYRAEPLVRGSGGEGSLKLKSFFHWSVQRRGYSWHFSCSGHTWFQAPSATK